MLLDVQSAGLGGLGGGEVIFVIIVAVILFGGKKIPEMAKGLGEGIRAFKHSVRDEPKTPDEKNRPV